MHSRNPYRVPPNYVDLAQTYPALKPHLIMLESHVTIDYQNEDSLRCLTQALLHKDFDLSISLPTDRLCPPVPNRLNYLLWIQDIMQAIGKSSDHIIRGLDIGTGASAIYPLLGCRLGENWSFYASEIDPVSAASAQTNVKNNLLEDRIKVVRTSQESDILQPMPEDPSVHFDFTMCNPPFYTSHEEVATSAELKKFGPNAVCSGAECEMITPGGEVGFVTRIVQCSRAHKTRCSWFTSMLGKLSSVSSVVDELRRAQLTNYALTEFVQGQTRRWAVAWSFGDIRLPDEISRLSNPQLRHVLPAVNTIRRAQTTPERLPDLAVVLQDALASIDGLDVTTADSAHGGFDGEHCSSVVRSTHNSWSRNARRKRKQAQATVQDSPKSDPLYCMVCRLSLSQNEQRDNSITYTLVLECRWLQGIDRSLFETFSSHVNQKIKDAIRKL